MRSLWKCLLFMLNAKHAEVSNSFGPNFDICHLKTSYLWKVMLQVSVPIAFSVQRPGWEQRF